MLLTADCWRLTIGRLLLTRLPLAYHWPLAYCPLAIGLLVAACLLLAAYEWTLTHASSRLALYDRPPTLGRQRSVTSYVIVSERSEIGRLTGAQIAAPWLR